MKFARPPLEGQLPLPLPHVAQGPSKTRHTGLRRPVAKKKGRTKRPSRPMQLALF